MIFLLKGLLTSIAFVILFSYLLSKTYIPEPKALCDIIFYGVIGMMAAGFISMLIKTSFIKIIILSFTMAALSIFIGILVTGNLQLITS